MNRDAIEEARMVAWLKENKVHHNCMPIPSFKSLIPFLPGAGAVAARISPSPAIQQACRGVDSSTCSPTGCSRCFERNRSSSPLLFRKSFRLRMSRPSGTLKKASTTLSSGNDIYFVFVIFSRFVQQHPQSFDAPCVVIRH